VLLVFDEHKVAVGARRDAGNSRDRDLIVTDNLRPNGTRDLPNARHGTCFIRLRQERKGGPGGAAGMVGFGRARPLAVPLSQDEGSMARLEVVFSRLPGGSLLGHVLSGLVRVHDSP
jgi:hypothetical protein